MRVIGADGDGDGVVDVFAASATTSRVSWATGLGAGAFGPSITIDVLPSPPTDLVASDLDGDGALDVIVSTELGATYWYRGAPGAPFGARQVAVAAPGRHVAPALVDFDGDGALDLGLALAGSVSWFRQLSPGAFGPEQSISGALQEPADAAFVDLDGDGQVDALWSLGSGPDVAWCRGLGGGSFDPPASLTAGAPGAGRSIVVADVDLDGDLDLTATFNPPAGFASLYVARQLGPGSFEPFSGVALSIRDASRIAVGDLDGDGDLEIVLPREASDSVTRLENETVSFLGAAYCGPAATNIAGLDGRIGAVGSLAVQNNSATLRASRLPVGVFGFFITSRTAIPPTPVGSGVGLLCVGGMIGRYIAPGQVLQAGADGGFELALDLANMPTPTGLVPALGGDTWNFQAWYRDSAGGSPSSNFTDALAITWE